MLNLRCTGESRQKYDVVNSRCNWRRLATANNGKQKMSEVMIVTKTYDIARYM